jgi:hypothetical protein|mmetsp:Transcript_97802/g.164743  ORF Transcript_97802/g.164743 Transcript_97802/m.164743 type:complete len:115 (-) Transcript_97802:723-1067(-)
MCCHQFIVVANIIHLCVAIIRGNTQSWAISLHPFMETQFSNRMETFVLSTTTSAAALRVQIPVPLLFFQRGYREGEHAFSPEFGTSPSRCCRLTITAAIWASNDQPLMLLTPCC